MIFITRGGIIRQYLNQLGFDSVEDEFFGVFIAPRLEKLSIVKSGQTLSVAEWMHETVYALDSTTIDLCLSLFPWAKFRTQKGAVKMHTLLDLRSNTINVTSSSSLFLKSLASLFCEVFLSSPNINQP